LNDALFSFVYIAARFYYLSAMGLKNKIDQEIKEAMKARLTDRLNALRAIKAAILLAETSEGRAASELTEAEEIQVLNRQAKQRKDAYSQFLSAGREDLAAKEAAELAIIEEFLPKQLTEAEIEAALRVIIAKSGAEKVSDLGKVMKLATAEFAGKADGKVVSELAKKLLN
jgi:uncharacterized protein YqeY